MASPWIDVSVTLKTGGVRDRALLLRWDIEHPGQVMLMPSPMLTRDGVEDVDSAALPTFRTGAAMVGILALLSLGIALEPGVLKNIHITSHR